MAVARGKEQNGEVSIIEGLDIRLRAKGVKGVGNALDCQYGVLLNFSDILHCPVDWRQETIRMGCDWAEFGPDTSGKEFIE